MLVASRIAWLARVSIMFISVRNNVAVHIHTHNTEFFSCTASGSKSTGNRREARAVLADQ